MVDQFIGIDSCMLHAADMCRVPSVALFSQMYSPFEFGLRFADGETLQGASPPADITVEAVWEAYCRVRDRQQVRRGHT
jgi:ADP-heptose:LPS heptosyltransferase